MTLTYWDVHKPQSVSHSVRCSTAQTLWRTRQDLSIVLGRCKGLIKMVWDGSKAGLNIEPGCSIHIPEQESRSRQVSNNSELRHKLVVLAAIYVKRAAVSLTE